MSGSGVPDSSFTEVAGDDLGERTACGENHGQFMWHVCVSGSGISGWCRGDVLGRWSAIVTV